MGRAFPDDLAALRTRIVDLSSRGLKPVDIASALSVTRATVYRHLAAHRGGGLNSNVLTAGQAVEMLDCGYSRAEIASRFGVTRARVSQVLSDAGLTGARCSRFKVPLWVPADLHDDYLDFARDFDVHYAARRCRRLKAEAA